MATVKVETNPVIVVSMSVEEARQVKESIERAGLGLPQEHYAHELYADLCDAIDGTLYADTQPAELPG